jgi:rhodanese-related sulfurtransferase
MSEKINVDVKAIERSLLEEEFPNEAAQLIDLDNLSEYERNLLNKCLNHEHINDDEFKDLKKLLNDYRPYLEKYKPAETIEAVEKTKRTIATEKDFLDMVENADNILKINIPFRGELFPAELEILPLEDSRMINQLSVHVDLFKGMEPEDILLYNDAQQGKELTKEEQAIVDKMNKEINERASENRMKQIDDLLASQTRLKDSDADYDTRLKFWQRFNFQAKFAIYFKVEDMLGLNEEITNKLFRND